MHPLPEVVVPMPPERVGEGASSEPRTLRLKGSVWHSGYAYILDGALTPGEVVRVVEQQPGTEGERITVRAALAAGAIMVGTLLDALPADRREWLDALVAEQGSEFPGAERLQRASEAILTEVDEPRSVISKLPPESPEHQPDDEHWGAFDDEAQSLKDNAPPFDPRTVAAVVEEVRHMSPAGMADLIADQAEEVCVEELPALFADFIESRFKADGR
jgi:hypothetical protein